MYPNPSDGIFALGLKDESGKIISVKVEDILANEVFSVKNFSSIVDISSKATGIYFVHVTTQKKKMFAAKIVKE